MFFWGGAPPMEFTFNAISSLWKNTFVGSLIRALGVLRGRREALHPQHSPTTLGGNPPSLLPALCPLPPAPCSLLQVLLLLPEEVDSRHLRLGSNRRSQIKQMLSLSSPHIAQFLQSLLAEPATANDVVRQVHKNSAQYTLHTLHATRYILHAPHLTWVSPCHRWWIAL